MANQDKAIGRLCIGGGDLRRMLAMGTALLAENEQFVNSLNVFPVPDGDTGTNMLWTMQSAMEELSRLASEEVGAVAQAVAHGSLMGARGNSGVILSQILRGIARAAEGRDNLSGRELADALKEGANTAYRGIGKPVEGTMLTVARAAAEAAVSSSEAPRDVLGVLRSAVEAARRSLESTPDLLPILKEAGVVDAGGQGYLLLLEGARMFLTGERTPPPLAARRNPIPRPAVAGTSPDYGYCTEVLIRGDGLEADAIRDRLEALGSSVIVVGDPGLVHLHVHTHRPGDVLNLASGLGSLERTKVENMQLQHTAYLSSGSSPEPVRVAGVGVVPVVTGSGLVELFRDLGAAVVVPGGQSMNPSIEELVHGAECSGFAGVILLPNNPNVVLTAQQAQAVARAELRVVPTRTVCEGIAAMVAFNPGLDLAANVAAMSEAASAVQTIELTRAVRSTQMNGLQIALGQVIGMLDGALVQAGDSLEGVALKLLEQARASEHEVVTVYCGETVSPEDGRSLAASIQGLWPAVQVEVVEGGQPFYPYIISVE